MTNALVDENALKELQSIMGDDFRLLVDTFLNDSTMRIAAIKAAIEAQDEEALRTSAHSLKGSALNLSAAGLIDLCKVLEQMGREGVFAGAMEKLVALEQEFADVKRFLQHHVLA